MTTLLQLSVYKVNRMPFNCTTTFMLSFLQPTWENFQRQTSKHQLGLSAHFTTDFCLVWGTWLHRVSFLLAYLLRTHKAFSVSTASWGDLIFVVIEGDLISLDMSRH